MDALPVALLEAVGWIVVTSVSHPHRRFDLRFRF